MKVAHARRDPDESSRLNEEAAERASGDARRFHLTQAWIYALEAGRPDADRIERRLRAEGGFSVSTDFAHDPLTAGPSRAVR